MGWATRYIADLKEGKTVIFRPQGNSMSPRIQSGQLCTVEPLNMIALQVGEIVLCKVNGTEYLHLIKAIQGDRIQIGNNHGRINGWVGKSAIFGRLTHIE